MLFWGSIRPPKQCQKVGPVNGKPCIGVASLFWCGQPWFYPQRRHPICSIEGCKKEVKTRGWCRKHYKRWYTHGDPTVVLPKGRPALNRTCSLEECDRQHEAHGYCKLHYRRWVITGDPRRTKDWTESNSAVWKGSDITYCGAHRRVYRKFGSAETCSFDSTHDGPYQWAFNRSDPSTVLTDPEGYSYSPDPDDYLPLCVLCHVQFDKGPSQTIANR